MKWGVRTKQGFNELIEKQKGPFLFNQAASELLFSSIPLAHLHLFNVPASIMQKCALKKVVQAPKWVASFPHIFNQYRCGGGGGGGFDAQLHFL